MTANPKAKTHIASATVRLSRIQWCSRCRNLAAKTAPSRRRRDAPIVLITATSLARASRLTCAAAKVTSAAAIRVNTNSPASTRPEENRIHCGVSNEAPFQSALAAPQTSEVIKAADPRAIVVSAGLSPTSVHNGVTSIDDRAYLHAMYEAGLAYACDAIGSHPYGYANPPEVYPLAEAPWEPTS